MHFSCMIALKEEDIINFFMLIRQRRPDKNKKYILILKDIFIKLLIFYHKLMIYLLCRKKICQPR
jgi:hypothetical protein